MYAFYIHVCTKPAVMQRLKMRPTYFIMRGDIQCHDSLQEGLGCLVVGEERVSVHVIQVTVFREGTAGCDPRDRGGVQTQQRVQPALHRVAVGVTDRVCQNHFVQDSS